MSRRGKGKPQPAIPGTGNVSGPAPTLSDSALVRPMTVEPSLVQQFTRIGGNLSPQMISAILTMADIGRISRFVDLVHEFRQKDGHMHACLQASELAIGALPWDITPPDQPNRKERVACQMAKEALQENKFFRILIEHFAGEGRLFGHAHAETIWDKSGGYYPTVFKPISSRRFGFRMSDGALLFDPRGILEADVNACGVDLLAEYPLAKFLQYRPRVNGDVVTREGLGRFLVWLAVGRNWTYKDWLELAELAWKPKRLGKYQKGASLEDKQALIAMLEQVMAGGVGIFAETTEPRLEWPSQSAGSKTSTHKELQLWIGGEMSKGILGSTDILEPSEFGSKSALEERGKLRTDIRNAMADSIALSIQPVVVAITKLNKGDGIRSGKFSFITEDPADLEKFAGAVEKLGRARVRIVESWVHDQAGMPSPKPNDILVGDQVDADGKRVLPSLDDKGSEAQGEDAAAQGEADGEAAGDGSANETGASTDGGDS
jgi:phage gp29-like protein